LTESLKGGEKGNEESAAEIIFIDNDWMGEWAQK
jgi:hypothetical protein